MKKRIISLLIALIMLIGLLPMSALAKDDLGGIPFGGGDYYAADGRVAFNALENEKVSIQSGKAAEDGLAEGAAKGDTGDGSLTVLAFTSDTHNTDGRAANRLGTWLDKMADKYGKVEVMAFGGDMANASASESDFWTLTQADMNQLEQRNVYGVYTTGNHEYSPGNYTPNKNDTTKKYIENAQGIEGYNYRIYCLGSSAYAESSGGGSWSAPTSWSTWAMWAP